MSERHYLEESPLYIVGPCKGSCEKNRDGSWKYPRRNVLYIKTLEGQVLEIGVDLEATIADLKYWIFKRTTILPQKQRIIFAGRELSNDAMSLRDTNMEYESTFHLVVRKE